MKEIEALRTERAAAQKEIDRLTASEAAAWGWVAGMRARLRELRPDNPEAQWVARHLEAYLDLAESQRPTNGDALLREVERLRDELAHHHCDSCDGSAPECWRDKRKGNGAE